MTTLVAVRQTPLEVSMSNKPDRRPGKRLADFENDGDFQFARKPKKAKTEDSQPQQQQQQPVRRSPRGKQAQQQPATIHDEPQLVVRKNASRRSNAAKGQQGADRDNDNGADRSSRTGETHSGDASSRQPRHHQQQQRFESPEPSMDSATTIVLPMADTPVINRNKEFRKKGSSSGRRSSLGSRGRRASQLFENGQSAIPHREVDPATYYKHISSEELSEPQRMQQLLVWCGDRALPEKAGLGTANSSAMLSARAIQDQLSKDFGASLEFSDWQRRDSDTPVPPIARKPNPRNLELDKKMKSLEARIKRLQEEQAAWQSIQKPPPSQPPPLFDDPPPTTTSSTDTSPSSSIETPLTITLPETSLLDSKDAGIRTYLAAEMEPFASLRAKTHSRLAAVQRGLEFQIDHLADNVHKLEQRVRVAGSQADHVLAVAAARLKRREDREKKAAGTREMPMMEVLRSLGGILPEGRGGDG